jgi:hypothetical protein
MGDFSWLTPPHLNMFVFSGSGLHFLWEECNICLVRERKCHLKIWTSYTRFALIPTGSPTDIRQFLSSFVTRYMPYVCAATNDTYPNKGMSCSTNKNNSLLLYQFPNNVRRTGRGQRCSWRKSGFLFDKLYNTGIWMRTPIFHEKKTYPFSHSNVMAKESHAPKGLYFRVTLSWTPPNSCSFHLMFNFWINFIGLFT